MLTEAQMMVPDCMRRLIKAFEELNHLLKNELDLKDSDEFDTALAILEAARIEMPEN